MSGFEIFVRAIKDRIFIHGFYIISFLVIVIIFLLAKSLHKDIDAVQFISFAATLSSLILAVIAIIYSIISNGQFSSSISKMSDSAEVIGSLSKNVDITISSVKESTEDMKSFVSSFSQKVEELYPLLKNIQDKSDSYHSELVTSITEISTLMSDKNVFNKKERVSIDNNRTPLEILIITLGIEKFFYIFMCYVCALNKKSISEIVVVIKTESELSEFLFSFKFLFMADIVVTNDNKTLLNIKNEMSFTKNVKDFYIQLKNNNWEKEKDKENSLKTLKKINWLCEELKIDNPFD